MKCIKFQQRVLRRKTPQALPLTAIAPRASRNVRANGGVYVPSDSFGGQSPERKAAGILRTFFTFVAARVVLAQLEGSGRGAVGAYDSQAATDLHRFLQEVPMRDGDEWLAAVMRQNSSLGLRLMEVRDHYCEEAFEWDQLQRLAKQEMKGANTRLMRKFAAASLAASLAAETQEPDVAAAADTSAAPAGPGAVVSGAAAGAGQGGRASDDSNTGTGTGSGDVDSGLIAATAAAAVDSGPPPGGSSVVASGETPRGVSSAESAGGSYGGAPVCAEEGTAGSGTAAQGGPGGGG